MSVIYGIDVSHPPMSPDAVELALTEAWSHVRNSPTLRLLKIVHGYGSSGKGGTTKQVVRNWLFTRRQRFKLILDGESYSLYNPAVQELRLAVGQFEDGGLHNSGVTLVWIK